MAIATIDADGLKATMRGQIKNATFKERRKATRAGARVLQRRLKRWSPVDTGYMRRNIIIDEQPLASHAVVIPRRRFWSYRNGFYYPILFRKGWRRTVRRYRRDALRAVRRSLRG